MQLHLIDFIIIVTYLVAVVLVGFFIRKKASEDIAAYFLGGRSVPWYFLGVSNASSMFDITGTMWLVSILFVYGLKGAWLPWLWPTFNQIFLMIYLAVWIRRSGVITGAEWITTRFGEKWGGELSRLSVVVFALVSVVGFLSYAYQGIGRFASVILPWDVSPQTYGIVLMMITTVYVVLGGMYSVVLTDVIQFTMLTIAAFIIGYLAITHITPEQIAAVTPDGWKNVFFGWELNLNWNEIFPAVNAKIASDGYSLFAVVWMMILFKGILVSMAGTAPNYDMQRVLATRKPKESALMSGLVSVALFPRWLMIAGITLMGLIYFMPNLQAMGTDIDFEMIMPYVINHLLPVGTVGLIVAGLLAAYMSTFDSTVNAGAAYLVNDIYKRYLKPDASSRQTVWMSYAASLLVVILGIIFGLMSQSIHTVMQFIVSGLYGGYTAPNILKWHWWRFNGYGYFWGMIIGISSAMVISLLYPNLDLLYAFPIILFLSGAASILVSLFTKPDDGEVLKSFYASVRPWGFWKPIHEKVLRENPAFVRNASMKRDILNIAVGIVWQMTLVLGPVYLIIQEYQYFSICMGILIITSIFLKKNWYDRLEEN